MSPPCDPQRSVLCHSSDTVNRQGHLFVKWITKLCILKECAESMFLAEFPCYSDEQSAERIISQSLGRVIRVQWSE